MRSEASSFYSDVDTLEEVIRRAERHRTEALTAQREYMEDLLPKMTEALEDLIEEEKKLVASQSFRKKILGGFSKRRTNIDASSRRSVTSSKSKSDNLLMVEAEDKKTQQREPVRGSKSFVEINTVQVMPGTNDKGQKVFTKPNRKIGRSAGSPFNQDTIMTRESRVTRFSMATSSSRLTKTSKKKTLARICQARKELESALVDVREKAKPLIRRTQFRGSICGVHNPLTGEIEWATKDDGGVFGVFNPKKGKVIWKEKSSCCIYGVLNPNSEEIEWKECYRGGVCGVYNPILKVVEWKIQGKAAVFGVFNPVKEAVEWRTNANDGVVGWWEPSENRVLWDIEPQSGICRVMRDYDNGGYKTYSCNLTRWLR